MKSSMRKVGFAATVGTMIEWYDFFIYGTAAALVFNRIFFPQFDPLVGTMLAFGSSATGFLARPVGALVAGHYGDRVGRKALLTATLLIMGLSTLLIGMLPTYDQIGIWAPAALLILRLAQGFATGGEWGGAALMTVEHAGGRRRGLWGSLITVGIMSGLVLASLVFSLASLLPEEKFIAWGWRLPFLMSAVLVAVGLYIRLSISESPEFSAATERGLREDRPAVAALREWRSILVVFCIRVAESFSFYIFAAFSLTYVATVVGLPKSIVLNAILVAALIECVTCVLYGHLADRVGSKNVLLWGLFFQAALAFPFFWLLESKAPAMIFVALALGFAVGNAAISAVQPDYFARFFPVAVRYSGISIGRESASVIGGAFAPVIATGLVSWSGGSGWVAVCMVVTSTLGILAILVAERNNLFQRQPGSATVTDSPRKNLSALTP